MSIRPVDLGGMMQQTAEVVNLKTNDDNRAAIAQQTISADEQTHETEQAQRVNEQSNTEGGDTKYDAREEGKNKYQKNEGKKRQKKSVPTDKVTIKSAHSSFDITI